MMRLATTSTSGQKIGGFCASTLLGLSFESSEKVFNAKRRYRMGAAHFFPKSILRRMTRPFSWGAKSSNLGEEGAQATRTKRGSSTLSKISHTAHAHEYEILVCMGEMVPWRDPVWYAPEEPCERGTPHCTKERKPASICPEVTLCSWQENRPAPPRGERRIQRYRKQENRYPIAPP